MHKSIKTYEILMKQKVLESLWSIFVVSAKYMNLILGIAHAGSPFSASRVQK